MSALPYDELHKAAEVVCGYAVSGPYCFLQRILFYKIAVCVFCFRFHKWLTTFGLGYLATTSTVMSIHGVLLAADPLIGADQDFMVVFELLSACVFLTTSIFIFAPKVFNVSTKPLLGVWCVVITLAQLVTLFRFPAFGNNLDSLIGVEVCRADGVCANTCNTHLKGTLLRGGNDNPQPLWWARDLELPTKGDQTNGTEVDLTELAFEIAQSNRPEASDPLTAFNIAPFILLSLLLQLTILNLVKSPVTARNDIFRAFTRHPSSIRDRHISIRMFLIFGKIVIFLVWPLQLLYLMVHHLFGCGPCVPYLYTQWVSEDAVCMDSISTIRRRTARAFAVLWCLYASLGYLAWPALFLYKIITCETVLSTTYITEQESLRNVGQWMPWSITALGIIAALCHQLAYPSQEVHDIWSLQGMPRPSQDERPRWIGHWNQSWYWYVITKNAKDNLTAWWKDPITMSWKVEDMGESKLPRDGRPTPVRRFSC
jgi:hypothetical protein